MVSEKDIEAWDRGPLTKLYDVKPNSIIEDPWSGKLFKFGHIDGMYSYCTDFAGNVFHLSAFAEVIPLKGNYDETIQDTDKL